MNKKTILIANTHKEEVGFLKIALKKNNIDIDILDVDTNNSEDMKEAIVRYEPDIVLTNELKEDRPSTDIIKEFQDDLTKYQPIFIISSGFSTFEIERACFQKGIHAYSFQILDGDDKLAIEIGKIARGEDTELNKHEYYSFNKKNIDLAALMLEDNVKQYMYDSDYKKINHEISLLHDELQKIPKRYREKIINYESLLTENNMLEISYMYQYFKNRMNS